MRILRWLAITMGLLVVVFLAGYFIVNRPLPVGIEGQEAELLADRMLTSLDVSGWDTTRYVNWCFAERHTYAWDRKTDSVVITWGDTEVRLHTKTIAGSARRDGKQLSGIELENLIQDAWGYFCNDSFWLIAPYKIRDPGTTRALVKNQEEGDQLLVTYSSGGVTPGDAYLWSFNADGSPASYRMWVSIIPVGGVKATWEDYVGLPTGAKIAQVHDLGMVKLNMTNLSGGGSIR